MKKLLLLAVALALISCVDDYFYQDCECYVESPDGYGGIVWDTFDGPCRPQHNRNWEFTQETCYDYYY